MVWIICISVLDNHLMLIFYISFILKHIKSNLIYDFI